MKKYLFLLAAALFSAGIAAAAVSADRPIAVDELPAAAQKFIRTHFESAEVLYAKVDDGLFDNDYKVVFADGASIEFASNGEWKTVKCKRCAVPASVVPLTIREQVFKQFPKTVIESIERDRRGYEVELSNGLDLKFDRQMNLVEIDD